MDYNSRRMQASYAIKLLRQLAVHRDTIKWTFCITLSLSPLTALGFILTTA